MSWRNCWMSMINPPEHSACKSAENDELPRNRKVKNMIQQKGYRNHPWTTYKDKINRLKSKTRRRVENLAGFQAYCKICIPFFAFLLWPDDR